MFEKKIPHDAFEPQVLGSRLVTLKPGEHLQASVSNSAVAYGSPHSQASPVASRQSQNIEWAKQAGERVVLHNRQHTRPRVL